jgi:hypothetical protein
MSALLNQQSGYAREVGSGDNSREASGRALRELRDRTYTALGRKARQAAI